MLPKMTMIRDNFSLLCLFVISFIILFLHPVSSLSSSKENSKPSTSHLSLLVMPTKEQLSHLNHDLDVAESGGLGSLGGGLGGGAIKKVCFLVLFWGSFGCMLGITLVYWIASTDTNACVLLVSLSLELEFCILFW